MAKSAEDRLRQRSSPSSGTEAHSAVIPGFADTVSEGEEEESDGEWKLSVARWLLPPLYKVDWFGGGTLLWLYLLLGDSGLAAAIFIQAILCFSLLIVVYESAEADDKINHYVPKRLRPTWLWLKWAKKRWKIVSKWIIDKGYTIKTKQRRTSGFPLRYRRPRPIKGAPRMVCLITEGSRRSRQALFDSDAVSLLVDNCCSASITMDKNDFIRSPTKIRTNVRGVAGMVAATHKGTVEWLLEDDSGKIHKVLLPGTYLVPTMPSRMLSPQHWAQQAKDFSPDPEGTSCLTTAKHIVLYWHQRQ
jgi:hypothetical protein